MVFTQDGVLQIRDGAEGTLLNQLQIATAFDPNLHEHTDAVILSAIVIMHHTALVSIPHEGLIVEGALNEAMVSGTISTGGRPSQPILLD